MTKIALHQIEAIAHLRSDFPEKFGVPRQSGLVEQLEARIVFTPAYRQADALRGMEDFSHLWLIWGFSANKKQQSDNWQSTVRPPRLGGNKSMGVFATRSPFRPNGLGLSCVKISHIQWESPEGPVIHVLGADLMDGTPIYDIKPYVVYADSFPDAQSGFVDHIDKKTLCVCDELHLLKGLPPNKAEALRAVLAQDPRPSYQDDPERIYGMAFAGYNVSFKVKDDQAILTDIKRLP